MFRPPRLIALACIAVVLLTALTPDLWGGLSVVLVPLDPLFQPVVLGASVLPDDAPLAPIPSTEPLDSRGPPVL